MGRMGSQNHFSSMEDQKEPPDERILLIFGLGYSGTAGARAAVANGWQVIGTSRDPARGSAPPGVANVAFILFTLHPV